LGTPIRQLPCTLAPYAAGHPARGRRSQRGDRPARQDESYEERGDRDKGAPPDHPLEPRETNHPMLWDRGQSR
ncbi:MAG TPA: hypothetical protein PLV68_01780, partial [Ilumatobacteraceae bacterium]|nr:hypothetical protein [Ilumatobacteraceae bacterium]